MNYTVVIPAAGTGKRMAAGKNKPFLELDGKPLIAHTLSVFQKDEWCKKIILVVNPVDKSEFRDLLVRFGFTKVKKMVHGGRERQDSVREGLKSCDGQGLVLIHDGARPFVTVPLIHCLIRRALETKAAVPVVPITDTIKRVEGGWTTETLERSSLWGVQTPQAFRLPFIAGVHLQAEEAGIYKTDDAALLEHFGHQVATVKGSYDNFKITTPDDLIKAGIILEKRRRGGK